MTYQAVVKAEVQFCGVLLQIHIVTVFYCELYHTSDLILHIFFFVFVQVRLHTTFLCYNDLKKQDAFFRNIDFQNQCFRT